MPRCPPPHVPPLLPGECIHVCPVLPCKLGPPHQHGAVGRGSGPREAQPPPPSAAPYFCQALLAPSKGGWLWCRDEPRPLPPGLVCGALAQCPWQKPIPQVGRGLGTGSFPGMAARKSGPTGASDPFVPPVSFGKGQPGSRRSKRGPEPWQGDPWPPPPLSSRERALGPGKCGHLRGTFVFSPGAE